MLAAVVTDDPCVAVWVVWVVVGGEVTTPPQKSEQGDATYVGRRCQSTTRRVCALTFAVAWGS